MYTQNL